MMSNRPRLRAYHCLSFLLRIWSTLLMLRVYEVTVSMKPVMVDFGTGAAAGAWASATGAMSRDRDQERESNEQIPSHHYRLLMV